MNAGTIDTIRNRVPLLSVLPDVATKGICPFCKSEWFRICDTRGLYHCPDCEEQGDVITATMKLDGLSFREAVERLESRAEGRA